MIVSILILLMAFELLYVTILFKKYRNKAFQLGNLILLTGIYTLFYGKVVGGITLDIVGLLCGFLTFLCLGAVAFLLAGLLDYQIGIFLYSLLNTGVLIGIFMKFKETGKSVVWADLQGTMVWDVVWNMVLKNYLLYCVFAVLALIVAGYFLWKKRIPTLNFQRRLNYTLFGVIALAGLLFTVSATDWLQPVEESTLEERGSFLYFASSFDQKVMAEPAGYSEKNMQKIVEKYDNQFKNIKVTTKANHEIVIEILSEALADPETFSGTEWTSDPMPTIRKLQQENGGYLVSPVFGGGTANVEYGVVTGFNYSFLDDKINAYDYLNQHPERSFGVAKVNAAAGLESIALHTHLKTGYHRDKVLPSLGFSQFITREELEANKGTNPIYFKEGYLSDDTFFNQLSNLINKNSQKDLFIHSLSMQNHYPYTEEAKGQLKENQVLLKHTGALSAEQRQLALYARGVKETDRALELFLASLEKSNENVTVVMYGDHYPALDKKVYEKYPVKSKQNAAVNDHTTPYFIWKNHHRTHTQAEKDLQTPEGLSVRILEEEQIKVPVFYQFVAELGNQVTPEELTNEEKLTQKQQKLVNDYKLIQYDMLLGDEYSKEMFN